MNSSVTHTPVNVEERKALGIRSGDTVKVWLKIVEKGKTRRQAFEGLVLAVKHGQEPGAMFTVRRVSSGVGVEKIFPLYSPTIDSIEIVRRSLMRRSKLYFIREKPARDVKRAIRKPRKGYEASVAPELPEEVIESAPSAVETEAVA